MTTTAIHMQVQRSRFAHHILAALVALLPATLRASTGDKRLVTIAAKQRATAHEAEQVRQMASTYSRTDPGFAADLYAAAMRHEMDRPA